MKITAEPRDDYAFVRLSGHFDAYSSPQLQQAIRSVQDTGVRWIVLDLHAVEFINSTAIGEIIKLARALSAEDGKLVISRPSSFCRHIFDRIDLDRVVSTYENDEAAVAALGRG